ncbi:terpene cyclase/mutase family protein [Thermostilla marina]
MADQPEQRRAEDAAGKAPQPANKNGPPELPGKPSASEKAPSPAKQPTASAEATNASAGKQAAKASSQAASTQQQAQQQSRPEQGFIQEDDRRRSRLAYFFSEVLHWTPSWLVSMVFHIVLLLVAAMITLPTEVQSTVQQLVVAPGESEEIEEIEELLPDPPEAIDLDMASMPIEMPTDVEPIEDPSPFEDETAALASVEALSDLSPVLVPDTDLAAQAGTLTGDALAGRGSGKARLVATGGGTEGSERAVANALKWIVAHQLTDGGWSFNHALAPSCHGQCRNTGELTDARIAATGLALMPLLGAGNTHQQGKYRNNVKQGLYFLITRMKVSPQTGGGSLIDKQGRMYSHGIASIVLCEAYAMTHDRALRVPAQQAVNFIAYAQDPVGGGWRYQPRQAGDTSVVGWQLMALKSAHMGYLQVPPTTIEKAMRFLDSVQSNNGANYGYVSPGSGEATTAIGLLCRMYLGWKHDHPALAQGVKWLSNRGPSKNNMYYDYYATQVMRHWEGEEWKKWNAEMRDYLVESQATQGHEAGSWFFKQNHSEKGGRLYCTAMATMILEVYYRHLPIYRKQSTTEDFPLD